MNSTAAFTDIETYLGTFVQEMSERAERAFTPLFDPVRDPLSPGVLSSCTGDMTALPPQAAAVEAIVRAFRQHKDVWLNGEQGSGKTPMASWVVKSVAAYQARGAKPMRVLVTCPNHLVNKWKAHFNRIIPEAKVQIVRDYRSLLHLADQRVETIKLVRQPNGAVTAQRRAGWATPEAMEVYIIPRDRGKLGYAWRPAVCRRLKLSDRVPGTRARKREIFTTMRCPKCGRGIIDAAGEVAHLDYFMTGKGKPGSRRFCRQPKTQFMPTTGGRLVADGRGSVMRVCGEDFWQAHNGGEPEFRLMPVPGVCPRRMAPFAYLRRLNFRFDIYIADEVHELKGDATLQGQMFASLCRLSDRVLMMTGTLLGGYATNLYALLWRSNARAMINDGQEYSAAGHQKFAEEYGVLQETTVYKGDFEHSSMDSLVLGRGAKSRRTKVLPGISPLLLTRFLAEKVVFLRLSEMFANLPPFTERVHRVPMPLADDEAMKTMQNVYAEYRRRVKPDRAWSAARSAFLRWPDKPWGPPFSVFGVDDKTGASVLAFDVPQMPQYERPKELRVCRLVRRNMLRGRKTWVFTELTGLSGLPAWDWMEWMASCLRKRGVRVEIMRTSQAGGPKPEDRENWIAEKKDSVDVIISHPTLVQTGLDLYDFPSIVYAFPGDNPYRLRQASRRAWRLGQTEDCEVDYVVYSTAVAKSVQDAALSLMADKMLASLAIEGDLNSGGLGAMASNKDISTELARFIDGRLASIDSSKDAFARYREKFESVMPVNTAIQPPRRVVPPSRDAAPAAIPPVVVVPATPAQDPAPAMKAPAKGKASRTRRRPGLAPAAKVEVVMQPTDPVHRLQIKLDVLCEALGCPVDAVDSTWARFGAKWYALVLGNRRTIRASTFATFGAEHPSGLIAFVEPDYEAGDTTSACLVERDGVDYVVSVLPVADFLDGSRVARGPHEC